MSQFRSDAAPPARDAPSGGDALSDGLLAASVLVDPSAVANLTVKHLRDLCRADGAALYWWDDNEQVLLPLAVLDPRASRLHQVFHPGQGATGEAFSSQAAVLSNRYPAGLAFPPAWKVAEQVYAVAAVPLLANGEVCGVLTITQYRDADLTEGDVEVMQLVGEQVAPTLHGMRALAHAQFRLAEARELTALIRAAATAEDVGPVLEHICELSCRLLGAEFAGIALDDGINNRWSAAYGNISDRDSWPTEMHEWPLRSLLLDGEPFLLANLGDDPAWPLEAMPVIAAENLRTALGVPLVASDGTLLGGLALGWRFHLAPSPLLTGLARTLGAAATSSLAQASTTQALHEGEELWRLTLDNAPVGICLVRLDGTFRLVNTAMTRILGYSEDDLLTRDFESITDPSHLSEKQRLLDRLLAGDEHVGPIQSKCVHADGHGVWTSLSVQLLRDQAGEPEYFSAQIEDISAQHAQTAQLTYLTTHDSLTGLANRRLFYDVLTAQLNDAQNILICLGDIPELRGLDERFGHLTAGEIIREVAARLDTLVASTSVPGATRDEYGNRSSEECVARFAADEFAVMLSFAADVAAEQTVLHRVLPALQAPLDIGGRRHVLDFHIGVAQAPLDASVTQELLHAADIALSSARRSGRLSTLYTPAMGYEETHRQQLVFDLRAALNEGLLTMAYQPIVAADDGRLTAVEALARWTHPEFGPIPPDTFIPIAEESGLMPQLSAWALNTALAACARWQEHKPGVAVAVNLSATDLQNPPTAQLIADALGRYGLQPELLNIELTETTVMADFGAAISMLQDLSALGINLAIDDFGTGYSSLAYLRQMPMKALKIDRSFVTTMLSDQGDAAIVSMIIGLARTLGLRTIAEGVEDAPTADHLASLRCDRLQGYGIARPMSEDAFATWLPARRYDNGELPSSGF